MDEFHGLVRACAADPGDDTVRLVLADWLDDHGEPAWARFIRVQIQLHPHRGDYGRAGVIELEREERQLGRRCSAWLKRLGAGRLNQRQRVTFVRGLPGKLRLPLRQFLTDGPRLLAELPTIDTLALVMSRAGRVPEGLAVAPQVRHLELYGRFGAEDWLAERVMLGFPNLESLQAENFVRDPAGLTHLPAGLRAIRLVDYTGAWEEYSGYDTPGTPSVDEYRAAAPQWSFDWVRPYAGPWDCGDDFAREVVAGLAYSGPGQFARHDGRLAVVRWLPLALDYHVEGEDALAREVGGPTRGPMAEQLLDWWDSGQCHVVVSDPPDPTRPDDIPF